MYKRITAGFLCGLLLLSSMVACGDSSETEDTGENTIVESTDTGETEITRANTPDTLPDTLDFDGTDINIFYYGEETAAQYDGPSELVGDIVKDALYNRNLSVEERLDIKFNWTMGPSHWDEFPNEVVTLLQAGVSDYDMIFEENSRLFQQSIQGYFFDLMNKPHINLSQPWWYNDLMEQGSLDNSTRYFLVGDICLTTMLNASAIYFNKSIYADYFGDESDLYDLVLDGGWTVDRMMEYCRNVATDTNGDGVYDDEDLLGFRYEQWGIPNYLSMSIGLDYITRDSEGFPVLDIYNERTIVWADKLYQMLYTDNMSILGDKMESFINERSLFLVGQFLSAHKLRDTNFEYGIIPYPKLSEELEYTSAASTANGSGVGVPVSAPGDKLEAIFACIEALSAQSYRTVIPAWYDTALKTKYADNEVDAGMIDLIYENIKSPFIMMADKAIDIGSVFTRAVFGASSEGTFTSYWESNKNTFETNLKQMIEDYKSLAQ